MRRRGSGRIAAVSAKERRTRQFLVRLTEAESCRLREAAQVCAMTMAAWIRACALGEKPRPRPIVPEINRECHASLGRIGNNLNQMIQCLHERLGEAPEGPETLALMADIVALIGQVRREVLGKPA